jgi:MFS family permease
VVNAYALTFGGLLLLGGRAGDLLGRRKMFIAGLLLFSAASLAGGFATSPAFLLAARAVQGAGGALVAPAALSLITTTFPEGAPHTRALGVYAAMSIAGGAIGLSGGGVLTTYASWRWVLFVIVPIGAAVALAAPRVLAETPRRRGRFDLPGALAGTAGSPPWSTAWLAPPPARTASPTGLMARSSPRWWPPQCCSPRSRPSRPAARSPSCRCGCCATATAAAPT